MTVIFGEIDSPFTELVNDHVHLYSSLSSRAQEGDWDHLTDSERQRADRFRVPRIREQFIHARAMLRVMLASYLKCKPVDVPILLADGGKPYLPEECAIHFNLSHTDGLAIYAVSNLAVGIDVERVRKIPDALGLVERFFSPKEHADFCQLQSEQIRDAFLRAWTRKEAILKAMGRGVQSLDCCEVTFREEDSPQLISLDGDPSASQRWRLHSWIPHEGFMAALAVENRAVHN